MKTLDLSPRMIGKSIRITAPNIVGNHDHIEGQLRGFDIEVDEIRNLGGGIWRTTVTGLTVNISGIDIMLTGSEHLNIITEQEN